MVKAYEENGRGEEEDEDEDEVVEAEEEEAEEEAVEADEPGARTRRMKRRAAKAGTRARTEDLAMVERERRKASETRLRRTILSMLYDVNCVVS